MAWAVGIRTFHVKLTKGSTVIQGVLAEGNNGEPLLEIGDAPLEALNSGQRGRIVIPSFHHGSGQRIARDPLSYEESSSYQPDLPGVLRAVGDTAITTLSTDATWAANSTDNRQRGAIFSIAGVDTILVTPRAIFERATLAGAWTQVYSITAASTRLTGSYAVWGDRIFFGLEAPAGRASLGSCVRRNSAGVYTDSGNFSASYLVAVGSRLFRLVFGFAAAAVQVSWTDQTGTDLPTFSTTYTYPTQRYPMDMSQVNGQPLISLGADNMTGEVITMSVAGEFTNLVPEGIGSTSPVLFFPYLSGQGLMMAGTLRALVFSDLLDISVQNLNSRVAGLTTVPYVETLPQTGADGGVGAVGASSLDDKMFIAVKDQNAADARLIMARPHEEGLGVHALGLLPTTGYVQSLRVRRTTTNRLIAEGSIQDSASNTLRYYQMDLWDETFPPAVSANKTTSFKTSRYHGDILTTKRFSAVRIGRWYGKSASSGQQVLTVNLFLDESDTLVESFTVTANGPALYLPTSAMIGRSIGLEFSCPHNVATRLASMIECPIEIDYYGLPRKKDTIRLGLLAGSLQVTMGGTMTKQTRKDILDLVSSAIQTPEVWTLVWWDGRSDWTVVPVGQKTQEIESQARPGEGASLVWLTVERL